MKRVISSTVSMCTRSKKPKLVSPLESKKYSTESWVTATQLRNYMIQDPFLDWIKLYSNSNNRKRRREDFSSLDMSNKHNHVVQKKEPGFKKFILNRGHEFEEEIMNSISDYTHVSETINNESLRKVMQEMKNGTPIIHSAPLKNSENNTGGIADIIIRSDYINTLTEHPSLSEDKATVGCALHHDFHYVVIDVKFSTLPLRADGRHLLNSSSIPAYKSQLHIYNECLGKIQGYTPDVSFLLGRGVQWTSKNVQHKENSPFSRLGVVDFSDIDSHYPKRSEMAVKWLRDVRKNGSSWEIGDREEMFPNMKRDSAEWNDEKEKIADKIGEITKVWNCGVAERRSAISKGVTSWEDEKCTSDVLGISGNKGYVIDQILKINRQTDDIVRPSRIESNYGNWRSKTNEIFLDFENINDIFDEETPSMIFLIGVGYENTNGEWVYKKFLAQDATKVSERKMIRNFKTFMRRMGYPKIYYWHAEKNFWKNTRDTTLFKKCEWVDMCQLFRKEPVVVKDCFKFGLKPISKALYEHGCIDTELDSSCTSGMTAMVNAYREYKKKLDISKSLVMKEIVKYNEFDCKVMWDILSYLRNNH